MSQLQLHPRNSCMLTDIHRPRSHSFGSALAHTNRPKAAAAAAEDEEEDEDVTGELAHLDQSNIIQGGRRTRAFSPLWKAVVCPAVRVCDQVTDSDLMLVPLARANPQAAKKSTMPSCQFSTFPDPDAGRIFGLTLDL